MYKKIVSASLERQSISNLIDIKKETGFSTSKIINLLLLGCDTSKTFLKYNHSKIIQQRSDSRAYMLEYRRRQNQRYFIINSKKKILEFLKKSYYVQDLNYNFIKQMVLESEQLIQDFDDDIKIEFGKCLEDLSKLKNKKYIEELIKSSGDIRMLDITKKVGVNNGKNKHDGSL